MATIFALAVLRTRSLAQFERLLPILLNNNIKPLIRNSSISRYYSTSDSAITEREDLNNTRESKPEEIDEEIKITLRLPDNKVTVTSLGNANKISKRRGLLLFKVQDAQNKMGRPVYKLTSQTEYRQKELENDEDEIDAIKCTKTIQISAKINFHDLNTKLKNVIKLLEKKHKIKIFVNHGSKVQDKIMKSIEAGLKDHGMVQKNVKSIYTIYIVMPTTNEDNNN